MTHLIECKLSDIKPQTANRKPHTALKRFAVQWSDAQAVQMVRNLRHSEDHGQIQVRSVATWLQELDA